MLHIDTFETTFLSSNLNPPHHGYFQGYCFIGSDLVFGTAGAKYYQAATGKLIGPALDGCYVSVKNINDTYFFDIDFAGYKILYYYHDGSTWVVSNSFAQIVDFLRRHNIKVSPNYAHLAAIGGRGMAASQLFSLETPARGIRVAPRTHTLVITPEKAMFRRRPEPQHGHANYEEALSVYINTWVSRFETLMLADETSFTVDLTGGVDSRTNFALVHAAKQRIGDVGVLPDLHCESTTTSQMDAKVAHTVASEFSLKVREELKAPQFALSSEQSFQMHRNLSMGIYYPLYMPQRGPSPKDIKIGGGGGGIHRKTYELHIKSKDPDLFIRRYSTYFKRPEYRREFIRDGHEMMNIALQKGEDPLRVLLRDGRVRYHSGREARSGVAFTPLHSVTADQTQSLAGHDRIEEGQFNYDVMYSLLPKLVNMPFDTEIKSPTAKIRERLTSAKIPSHANPGKVWAPVAHLQSIGRYVSQSDAAAYGEAFDSAIKNPFVIKFWGQTMLNTARQRMELLRSGEPFGNAANGKPISAIFSADLVTPS